MGKSEINKEKMDQFISFFKKEIFPTIAGDDGAGVARFREIVERRREEVNRQVKKRQELANKK